MSSFSFTPDDQMQPIYCKECRTHIPRALTMLHGGRCESCAAARMAAQHAAAQEAAFQAQQAAYHAQQAAIYQAQQRAAQSVPPSPVYMQPTTIITPVYIQQPAPRRKGLNCCFALGCLLPFLLTMGGCALLTIFGGSGDTKPSGTPPAQITAAPATTYVPDTSGKSDAVSNAADKLVSDPNYHPEQIAPPGPSAVGPDSYNGRMFDDYGPNGDSLGYSGPVYSGGKTTYVHDYTRRNRNGTTSHVRSHYRR